MRFFASFFGASLLVLCVLSWTSPANQELQSQSQSQHPADYVDDIYHCADPSLKYELFYQALSEETLSTIGCDPDTFEWNLSELNKDAPPSICSQLSDEEQEVALKALAIDDPFEPCVLWAVVHRNLVEAANATMGPTIPDGIPDDLYHCRDPAQVGTDSITCNPETFLWDVQNFSPDVPPALCGAEFTISPEEVANVQDWFEPCVLWAMTYGNLRPTTSPMPAPTTTAPPTTNVSPPPSSSNVEPINDISEESPSSSVVVLDPMVLTLVWPTNSLNEQQPLSLDRFELRTLTEQHLLEELQDDLGLALVTAVSLSMDGGGGLPTSSSLTETLTGTVTLREDAGIPSATVLRLVKEAFQDKALELYHFRLKVAEDESLQQVDHVIVGTPSDFDAISGSNGIDSSTTAKESDNNDDQKDGGDEEVVGSTNTLMIAIIASVVAAVMGVCCFGLYVLYQSNQKAKFELAILAARSVGKTRGSSYRHNSSSIASSSRASHSRRSGQSSSHRSKKNQQQNTTSDTSNIHHVPTDPLEIPGMPTQSMSMEEDSRDYPPIYEDDEENQVSIISMSELDEQSHDGAVVVMEGDDHPEEASVYSYFNQPHDNESLLGSVANHSCLFSVGSGHRTDDDTVESYSNSAAYGGIKINKYHEKPKANKVGVLWSVMDTMKKHFGDDSSTNSDQKQDASFSNRNDDHRQNTTTNLLGRQLNYGSDEDSGDAGILFTNVDNETYSTPEKGLLVETYNSSQRQTIGEDPTSAVLVGASPDAKTPVKEHLERLWQKDDEEEQQATTDMVSGVHSVNAKSPSNSFKKTTEGSPNSLTKNDKASIKNITMVVNHIPDTYTNTHDNEGDDDEDDDDDKMVLRLPSQLQALDPHSDNISQSSSLSSRSVKSVLSSGTNGSAGRNNIFGAANIRAQSARTKRPSTWGSQHGTTVSLDSASTSSSKANSKASSKANSKASQAGSRASSNVTTDSAIYRALLNQADTNDAALLSNNSEKRKPKKDDSSVSSSNSQLSNLIVLSSLIKSVEDSPSSSKSLPLSQAKRQSTAGTVPDDSDEEDVYVEADDSDCDPAPLAEDKKGASTTTTNSHVPSTDTSKADQKLSILRALPTITSTTFTSSSEKEKENPFSSTTAERTETTSMESPVKNETPTKNAGTPPLKKEDNTTYGSPKNTTPNTVNSEETNLSFESLEKKLSFEVVDSSDDETTEGDLNHYDYGTGGNSDVANAINMERLRRLSLAGYAETMASF